MKSILYNSKISTTTKNTKVILPEINGYTIDTEQIKLLEINGTVNYVFSILPIRANSVTFRNITIQEKNSKTTAVMTIYTPTKNWIQNNRLGKAQKFEGKVDIISLDLNSVNILSSSSNVELKSSSKISSLNSPIKTSDAQYQCTSVNVWVSVPYQCASGMGHWPWDFCSIEDPEMRPGYTWESETRTTCSWIQTDPPPTGTGETTPNPPPGYDPCDDGLPEGTQLPVSTIDDTPCDSVNNPIQASDLDNAILVDTDTSRKVKSISKYINCFNDGKTVASYTMTIYIDQPVANNNAHWVIQPPNYQFDPSSNGVVIKTGNTDLDVGHAFICFEKNNSDGTNVRQTVGFYPGSSPLNSKGIIKDDSGHAYDVSYTRTVTALQFNDALASLSSHFTSSFYDLKTYNCTDAAISIMNDGGANFSSVPRGGFNNTPGDFGQFLRSKPTSNKNGGSATSGKGPCN